MQAELPPQEFQAQVLAKFNQLDTELREIKEQLSRIRFEMEASQKTGERLERLATSLIAGATIAVIAGVILSIIRSL
ncbi:MAG: hypothetical protein NZ482_09495 [Gloeomargarita sp. SKYG98]|nr:hypothetical protein [Gloeomargarita sp. SKYG98]